MIILGFLGLGRDAYRCLTRTFPGDYVAWRSLSLSLWFAFEGTVHCSRAFDLPHHESHRTAVLLAFALPIIAVVLAANLEKTPNVLSRRRRRSDLHRTDPQRPARVGRRSAGQGG